MADINFLQDENKDERDKRKDAEKEGREIIWSKPSEKKGKDSSSDKERKKGKFSGWLSFLKKGRPLLTPADKEKISRSREEVLKAIKEHEKEYKAPPSGKVSQWRRKAAVIFNSLFAFKKKKKKEVLFDYQKVLRVEEEKKSIAALTRETIRTQTVGATIKKKSFFSIFKGKGSKIVIFLKFFTAKIKEKKEKGKQGLAKIFSLFKLRSGKAPEFIKPAKIESNGEEVLPESGAATAAGRKESFRVAVGEEKEKEKKKERRETEEMKETEREYESAEILETDLLKEEIVLFFNWRKNITAAVIFLIIAGLAAAGVWLGLAGWGKNKKEESQILAARLDELNGKINKKKEEMREVFNFQNKLKLAKILLDQHIYWTIFFKFLEDNTIKDVYYTAFAGDSGGQYKIPAQAKSFSAISQQLQALRANSRQVVEANTSGGKSSTHTSGGKGGGISFELSISVNPEIFKK